MKLGLLAAYSHTTTKVPAEPTAKPATAKSDSQEAPESESQAVTNEGESQVPSDSTGQPDSSNPDPNKKPVKPKAKVKEEPLKQIFLVKLSFAGKEFEGKGSTLQAAKHDAATRGLEYFTDTEHFLEAQKLASSSQNSKLKAYRPPQFYKQQADSGKFA